MGPLFFWNSLMRHVLKYVRLAIIFLAVGMILLGQMFAGEFTVDHTLAGLGGFLAALLGYVLRAPSKTVHVVIVILTCLAVLGVGLNIASYHSVDHPDGAYYPWFLMLTYSSLVVLLGARHAYKWLGAHSS